MARLYMVRHGKAAAGFGGAMDPGLGEAGKLQAEAVAFKLKPLGPLPIITSPLARARETAAPLARLWNTEPVVDPRVGEIPSPEGMDLPSRVAWLRHLMGGTWAGADQGLQAWRHHLVAALVARKEDAVIFSHYVAINVAAAAAEGDDRITVFSPDNCSVTEFKTNGTKLTLIAKGQEAPLTKVN